VLGPDVFGEDDAGHCVLRVVEVPPALADQARMGEQNCPEGALSIEE
jgi:ferredoxin